MVVFDFVLGFEIGIFLQWWDYRVGLGKSLFQCLLSWWGLMEYFSSMIYACGYSLQGWSVRLISHRLKLYFSELWEVLTLLVWFSNLESFWVGLDSSCPPADIEWVYMHFQPMIYPFVWFLLSNYISFPSADIELVCLCFS